MSEFKPEPTKILETQADVLDAIQNPGWREGRSSLTVKSLWLIALIDEIHASGKYPYNSTVKKLAEERLGFPPQSDTYYSREGDALSRLIYNAQCYRRSDLLRANGFIPLTQKLIDQLGEGGKLVSKDGKILKIRKVGEKLHAFLPRKRNYAVSPDDNPVKIATT